MMEWFVLILGFGGFWFLSGISNIAAGVFLGIMAVIWVLVILFKDNTPSD